MFYLLSQFRCNADISPYPILHHEIVIGRIHNHRDVPALCILDMESSHDLCN
jgi:hypothetical protein